MKFARLIWKNALRNKRRSLLTAFSLSASLFLLTTLRTVLFELQAVSAAPQSDLRLVTRHAVAFTNPLPIYYLDRIKRIPGVREVIPGTWFGGIYIDQNNFFGQFTVDPEKAFVVFPEFQLPEDQKEAFRKQRNGAIAGVRLMQRFGWKIGDRITLMGTNYPVDLELVIVGGFTSINPPDEAALMFRWDYLDELAGRTGEAGWFTILARSREDMPGIIQAVDDMSRNSSAPTKTESEKEFQLSFSGMLGNIRFLVGSISAVVVFTILLVTAATMGMSIRERTAELGLLKSLGYSRGRMTSLDFEMPLACRLRGRLGVVFPYRPAGCHRGLVYGLARATGFPCAGTPAFSPRSPCGYGHARLPGIASERCRRVALPWIINCGFRTADFGLGKSAIRNPQSEDA